MAKVRPPHKRMGKIDNMKIYMLSDVKNANLKFLTNAKKLEAKLKKEKKLNRVQMYGAIIETTHSIEDSPLIKLLKEQHS